MSRRELESILREPKVEWLTFDSLRPDYRPVVTFSPYVTWKKANYRMTDEYRRNGWYSLEECRKGVRTSNPHALVAAPRTAARTPVVSIPRQPRVKAPPCSPVQKVPFPTVDEMEEVQPTPMDTTTATPDVSDVVIPNISESLSVWSCPPADTSLLDASVVALQATVARLQASPTECTAPFVSSPTGTLRPKNPLLKDDLMDCEPILEEDSTSNEQGSQNTVQQPEPVSMQQQQVSVVAFGTATSRKRRWEDAFGASDASSDADLPETEKQVEISTASAAIDADDVDSDDDMEEIRATHAESMAWYFRQLSHKEWNDFLLEHLSVTPVELVALYEEHHPQLKSNDDDSHPDDDQSKPVSQTSTLVDDDADDGSVQHHNCIESAAQSDADDEDASLQDSLDEDEDEDSKTTEDEDLKTEEGEDDDDDVSKTEDSTYAAAPVPLGAFYTCVPE